MKKKYLRTIMLALLLTSLVSLVRAQEFTSVQVTTENFPDPAFREYLFSKYQGLTLGGSITSRDVADVEARKFNIGSTEWKSSIASLQGIEKLTYLEGLDISDCTQITSLDISALTHLSNLNTSGCTGLINFYAKGHPSLKEARIDLCPNLKQINLSNCPELTALYFDGNPLLVALDVSNSVKLTSLRANNVQNLKYLNVRGCSAMSSLSLGERLGSDSGPEYQFVGSTTNSESFEIGVADPSTFATSNQLDLSGCTGLVALSIQGLKHTNGVINLNSPALKSITIRDITTNTGVASIDLSQATNLGEVDFTGYLPLRTVNFPNPSRVTRLIMTNSGYDGNLDLRNFPNLSILNADNMNNLRTLIVKKGPNTVLNTLNIKNNPGLMVRTYTDETTYRDNLLDLSNYSRLRYCQVDAVASIKELNLAGCRILSGFDRQITAVTLPGLESLDISGCAAFANLQLTSAGNLNTLNLGTTPLSRLTTVLINNSALSGNLSFPATPALTSCKLSGNRGITGLSFADASTLTTLYADGCNLSTFSFDNVPMLEELNLAVNTNLKMLDLTEATGLKRLFASNCGLEQIDLSANTALTNVDLRTNKLTRLDVSHNTALVSLLAGRNNLTAIDLSKNTELSTINFAGNKLSAVDLSATKVDVNAVASRLSLNSRKILVRKADNTAGGKYYILKDEMAKTIDASVDNVANTLSGFTVDAASGFTGVTESTVNGKAAYVFESTPTSITYNYAVRNSENGTGTVSFTLVPETQVQVALVSPPADPLENGKPVANATFFGKSYTHFRSFSSNVTLSKPAGLDVFTAALENNVMKLKKLEADVIPANVGVVLATNSESELNNEIPFTLEVASDQSVDATGNVLQPVVAPVVFATESLPFYFGYHSLAKDNYAKWWLGFYKADPNKPLARKLGSYVEAPQGSSAKDITAYLFDESISTDIDNTLVVEEAEAADDVWYTLQGQKIHKPTAPGIYIKNGKKVICN